MYEETQQNVEKTLKCWEESSEESKEMTEESDSDWEPEVKTKKRIN